MKRWILGIGLAMLPVACVGLMLATHEPIEWGVVALIALIVVPIFIFRTRVNKMETEFNGLSDRDKLKAVGKVAAHVAKKSIGH
jgi:membrane protein implicated in regulation of membrane protease activity